MLKECLDRKCSEPCRKNALIQLLGKRNYNLCIPNSEFISAAFHWKLIGFIWQFDIMPSGVTACKGNGRTESMQGYGSLSLSLFICCFTTASLLNWGKPNSNNQSVSWQNIALLQQDGGMRPNPMLLHVLVHVLSQSLQVTILTSTVESEIYEQKSGHLWRPRRGGIGLGDKTIDRVEKGSTKICWLPWSTRAAL